MSESADHPLCRELAVQARRAEPDLVLKARFLGLRKEVMSAMAGRKPNLVLLVRAETDRVAEMVLTECRQWREAGEWDDHIRHLQAVRAAAHLHLWLTGPGLRIARATDPTLGDTHVYRYPAEEE